MIERLKFDDPSDPEFQEVLRHARAAILAGRFKNRPTAIPNPVLARQLADLRDRVQAAVDVLFVSPERLIVLVTPNDGDDLSVVGFDALWCTPTDGLRN